MANYSAVKNILAKQALSQQEAEEQDRLERKITSFRIEKLQLNPIQGNFDFHHLSQIHYQLFHGLYDHAGKLRQASENWGKQDENDLSLYGEFAPIENAIEIIDNNSKFIVENNYFKDLSKDDFIYEFTISYAEVNSAHPFVDGNGRAMRVMFQQLAKQAGYEFTITNLDKHQWNRACLLSGKYFILYENDDGSGYTGEEQDIDIQPLLQIMTNSLIKK